MAKKSSYKIDYNAPVSLSIVIAMLFIFLLDSIAFKGSLIAAAFTCHGNASSDIPFVFSSAAEYIRLVTHLFGSSSWDSVLISSVFILLLGPQMEERYGSAMLALMAVLCTFISGVLNACLIPQSLTGQSAFVFMLILLAILHGLEQKQIQITWILLFVMFLAQQMYSASLHFTTSTRTSSIAFISFMQRNVSTFTSLAAGISGSLFGLLVAPKAGTKRKAASDAEEEKPVQTRTYQSSGTTPRPMATPYDRPNPYDGTTAGSQITQEQLDALDAQSPRFKNKKSFSSQTEEIGTLKL
ncbi:MAG: rhomboid family intramembrane serine protease [Treponema sp.]|nr:rhomboid family intramembrane serine protease [Treponema sp.]